ncbi:uncharacterized protein KD926_006290 [Aspergillus affinis]|uniref:uncharacterized protein n=1 Tax=Aspergillus affinis TaxID=1070780 RepID=UPI0022FF43B3|nr:uncharacterized protein KD926_006290 [Aspergillus affinis]KAI9041953.1 hypothetical protein KD926_006290 [Aspergillus affinis]
MLKDFIDGEEANGSFACGGTILVDVNNPNIPGKKATSSPVKIFWSAGHDTTARKLVLPLKYSASESTTQLLRELVSSCDPASFGLGKKDVIDPKYRKAGKIDPEQFVTSFHPADFGLLDNIEQVLLPAISGEGDNRLQFRKIKAELYKLNTYSGPSGRFRKHVDTPRSESQIRSLVVCLPSPFEGGRLIVRHGGQTVEFDWSLQSSSTIQWAAFYSDCEHEIKTITYGDRITLTYNLFVTEPVDGAIPSPTSIIDPKSFPLHSWVKNLLSEPKFMKEGGVLGVFCSHAYPHTSKLAETQFLRSLKGKDLVLYSVLKSLGIELAVVPIVDNHGVYASNPALGLKGTVDSSDDPCPLTFNTRDRVPKEVEIADVDQRWKLLLMTRQITGMDATIDYAAEHKLPLKPNSFYAAGITRVGKHFAPYEAHDRTLDEGDDENEIINDCFPICQIPGITLITEPKHKEMAFSHIAHGNEPSIETRYSCVAVLAVIPPTEKRMNIE